MRYAQIRSTDISDGPGIRVGVYLQGCSHRCKGCYNAQTWDFNGGKEWTDETTERIINLMSNDYISGLSLLGGDPICCYERDKETFINLVKSVKEKFPNKTIWIWTGYTFEQLYNFESKTQTKLQEIMNDLFDYVDVIVDGPYIESMRKDCKYYGSTNQRVIDVQGSIKNNYVTTII